MPLVVGIDGDDTLWHNERVFSMTETRFQALVAPWAPEESDLEALLLKTEQANLSALGYGVKSFTLSMIETAVTVSEGRIPAGVIAEIIAAGKEMLAHPVELLDGVAETIEAIGARWPIILVTKGDLFHQESKIARSGLLPHIQAVEIVSEKDPDTYRNVLARAGVDPADFVMVGDSLRSDIVPTLEVGGRAVHVPGTFREWELDRADVVPDASERWRRVTSIREVPAVLSSFDRSR
jgi:putative hydrolase of the HAD superfamily